MIDYVKNGRKSCEVFRDVLFRSGHFFSSTVIRALAVTCPATFVIQRTSMPIEDLEVFVAEILEQEVQKRLIDEGIPSDATEIENMREELWEQLWNAALQYLSECSLPLALYSADGMYGVLRKSYVTTFTPIDLISETLMKSGLDVQIVRYLLRCIGLIEEMSNGYLRRFDSCLILENENGADQRQKPSIIASDLVAELLEQESLAAKFCDLIESLNCCIGFLIPAILSLYELCDVISTVPDALLALNLEQITANPNSREFSSHLGAEHLLRAVEKRVCNRKDLCSNLLILLAFVNQWSAEVCKLIEKLIERFFATEIF